MDKGRRRQLEAAGYAVGDVQEFLGLTDEEFALIKMKIALAKRLREWRKDRLKISQAKLAKKIGSSQPRVAKMEAADRSVSLELLVRSLLTVGVGRREIGHVIGSR